MARSSSPARASRSCSSVCIPLPAVSREYPAQLVVFDMLARRVVGGLYLNQRTSAVESLLLGLYDEDGLLHYVGKARAGSEGEEMAEVIKPLTGRGGFTGRAPGGTSRWTGRERQPVPLHPVLVIEVSADHITGDYMRHGARLLRVRDDKRPEDCRIEQIR